AMIAELLCFLGRHDELFRPSRPGTETAEASDRMVIPRDLALVLAGEHGIGVDAVITDEPHGCRLALRRFSVADRGDERAVVAPPQREARMRQALGGGGADQRLDRLALGADGFGGALHDHLGGIDETLLEAARIVALAARCPRL